MHSSHPGRLEELVLDVDVEVEVEVEVEVIVVVVVVGTHCSYSSGHKPSFCNGTQTDLLP